MQRAKYLIANTVLFALNSIGTKLISFFLVPLYTATFSTNEFGIVDFVTTLSTIIVPVITLNIGEAVMRFSLDDDADEKAIVSIAGTVMVFSSIIGLLAIPLSSLSLQLHGLGLQVYLYCVSQGFFQIAACNLRGRELLTDYAAINILNSVLSAVLNIALLVFMRAGIKGYFLAFTLANAISASIAFIRGSFFSLLRCFHFSRELSREMLKYSIVLVPNSLMWWIMNSSDRLMIIAMVGVGANGVYAVSYKLPTVLSSLSTVFNQAWSYSAIHEDSSSDRDQFSNSMFHRLFLAQLLVTSLLLAILKPFMTVYVSENYYSAWRCTVPLLIGFFFMSLGTFMSTSYTVNKDSRGFLFSGVAGALTNILLNLLLIPRFGTIGAAVATCVSYFIVFLYRVVDVRKYIHIQVFTTKHCLGVILLLVMACGSFAPPSISCYVLLGGVFASILLSYSTLRQLVIIVIATMRKRQGC